MLFNALNEESISIHCSYIYDELKLKLAYICFIDYKVNELRDEIFLQNNL